MKPSKQTLIGAGCGLLVGIAMMAPLRIHLGWTPVAEHIWGLCNGPAVLLAAGFFSLWHSLGLGPHGDAGWAVLFIAMGVAIVLQWVVVGTIVGSLVARRRFKLAAAICAVIGVAVVGIVLWFAVVQWLFMDKTVAAFRQAGGYAKVDENRPDKPIVKVTFCGPRVNDATLENLKGLSELQTLDLADCTNVTDAGVKNVKGLGHLLEIRFKGREVTDVWLGHIQELTQLQSLDLLGCPNITDAGLAHLEKLTNLETLGLEGCRQVTDAGIEHLQGLTRLHELMLGGTKIGDDGLSHLKGLAQLQSLNLDGCKNVTDVGLGHLQGLANLKSLSLQSPGANVKAAGVRGLQKAMPTLQIAADYSLGLGYQGLDDSMARGPSGEDASREQKQVDEPTKTDLKADAALAEIRKAIAAKPSDPEAYYRYGLALAGRHELGEAATQFRKALILKPDYAEAHYQFGLALAGQGRPAEAITEYRKALTLKPDLEEARRSLDEAMATQQKDR